MRFEIPLVLTLTTFWLTNVAAQDVAEEKLQDVLCEQCPYDAPVRPAVPNVFSSTETRSLGIISVREMIDQLPDNVAAVQAIGPDDVASDQASGNETEPETDSEPAKEAATEDDESSGDDDSLIDL